MIELLFILIPLSFALGFCLCWRLTESMRVNHDAEALRLLSELNASKLECETLKMPRTRAINPRTANITTPIQNTPHVSSTPPPIDGKWTDTGFPDLIQRQRQAMVEDSRKQQ